MHLENATKNRHEADKYRHQCQDLIDQCNHVTDQLNHTKQELGQEQQEHSRTREQWRGEASMGSWFFSLFLVCHVHHKSEFVTWPLAILLLEILPSSGLSSHSNFVDLSLALIINTGFQLFNRINFQVIYSFDLFKISLSSFLEQSQKLIIIINHTTCWHYNVMVATKIHLTSKVKSP